MACRGTIPTFNANNAIVFASLFSRLLKWLTRLCYLHFFWYFNPLFFGPYFLVFTYRTYKIDRQKKHKLQTINLYRMKFGLLFLLLAITAFYCGAQELTPKKIGSQITALIDNENYPKAAELIEETMEQYPHDKKLDLQLGICYLYSSNNTLKALMLLEKAVMAFPMKGKTLQSGIEANYYYGEAFHKLERFLEAKEVFENLQRNIPAKQKALLQQISKELAITKNAIELTTNPVVFQITNLGPKINTPYDEHSPLISADESVLVFTSNRPGTGNTQTADGKYFEDVYVAEFSGGMWQKAEPLGNIINTDGNNATASISADGNLLVIYQHDGLSGDLYTCEKGPKGWETPVPMPYPINSSYNETHGCFSADGQAFVFTSDRPEGFGGRDIYMVRKLPSGEWGKALNLGKTINTDGEEDSPFLSPDGKILYFSSTEHKTMGGFDIFKTTYQDSLGWSTPENIGYPINTTGDDLFYNPSVDGTRVYYASQREKGEGGIDIHLIEFDASDPRALAVVSGYVFDAQKQPFTAVNITVEDAQSGEVMGYYRPSRLGKYIIIVPAGKTYKVSYNTSNKTYYNTFSISSRQNYTSGNWAHYLEPIYVNE
jgi:Tol biopolymer transport system component